MRNWKVQNDTICSKVSSLDFFVRGNIALKYLILSNIWMFCIFEIGLHHFLSTNSLIPGSNDR